MDVMPASRALRNGRAASLAEATSNGEPAERPKPIAADEPIVSRADSPPDVPPLDLPSLVARHQAEIWRYVRFLGCDDAQADDVVQETFLAVLKKPPSCREPAAVRAYLRMIARNALLASFRKTNRQAEFDLDAAERIWAETHPRDGGEERLSALDDCLGQLDGRAKQAIDLAYRENQSRADIAAKLDMSEDGVKSLLRRTRDVLRQCVERKINAAGE